MGGVGLTFFVYFEAVKWMNIHIGPAIATHGQHRTFGVWILGVDHQSAQGAVGAKAVAGVAG